MLLIHVSFIRSNTPVALHVGTFASVVRLITCKACCDLTTQLGLLRRELMEENETPETAPRLNEIIN